MMKNKWLSSLRHGMPIKGKVYALPWAGGSASCYLSMYPYLSNDIEFISASLPGRSMRLNEPPEPDMQKIVFPILEAIHEEQAQNYILFGHSMGAMLCFELARLARHYLIQQPLGLVVSGASAPHLFSLDREPVYRLSDEKFIDYLRQSGSMEEELLDNHEFMALILPALRNDFQLCYEYVYQEESPLEMPIVVLGGIHDTDVSISKLEAWSIHTSLDCNVHNYEGNHFFIQQQWKNIADIFERFLSR
jgi:medium-chain acyl-[acyl-carrier-protein] hydrolase